MHTPSSLGNRRHRWLIRQTHHLRVCAGTLPTEQSQKATPTCSHLYTCNQVHWNILLEPQRWRLVRSVQSTSKGHLWHLRSLANDDAQRSFATTKAEQKNWHEREVNKHKAFNKTCFFGGWIDYKGFDCFCLTQHYKKEKKQEVLSHMTSCDAVISCQGTLEFGKKTFRNMCMHRWALFWSTAFTLNAHSHCTWDISFPICLLGYLVQSIKCPKYSCMLCRPGRRGNDSSQRGSASKCSALPRWKNLAGNTHSSTAQRRASWSCGLQMFTVPEQLLKLQWGVSFRRTESRGTAAQKQNGTWGHI